MIARWWETTGRHLPGPDQVPAESASDIDGNGPRA